LRKNTTSRPPIGFGQSHLDAKRAGIYRTIARSLLTGIARFLRAYTLGRDRPVF
jgi:hypothetical protein